ncbi:MAG: hypothetical protein ACRED4_05430 [Brevundimonas sp.]
MAHSLIAVRFETWNEHRRVQLGDEEISELERTILLETPRSGEDAARMLTVLLAELAGERCDGADLVALAAIRDYLLPPPPDALNQSSRTG